MTKKKTYGRTASGVPITEELVNELSAKAEAGFDVEEILRRRGGRPPMGSAPACVESVRLDPELRQALAQRASQDHETTSAVIRKALRQYLKVA
ncbi:MAG TPA: CopG family transcriptional regulator [Solirubrobacteraceae bacterium]|nr:CopG family transcriptional regulator [Solirubrobacteraceae bacterium]